MSDARNLTGNDIEKWFKGFALKAEILGKVDKSLEEIVRLFNLKLNNRLISARVFVNRDYPYGNEWIDRILEGRSLSTIRPEIKQEFSDYLLDRVLASDTILTVQNSEGRNIKIAVDVTWNLSEERAKLLKVQGRSTATNKSENDKNIPEVRKLLGIDKHLILVVNNQTDQLPSDEKLLSEIYSFVDAKAKTRSLDLTNLDPSERTNWRQSEAANPEQMWQKYSKGVQSKASNVIALEAAKRAFRDNHTPEAVFQMLTHDPQYRQFLRRDSGNSKFADLHVRAIRAGAEVEVAKEQQQRKPQQNRGPERGMQGPEL